MANPALLLGLGLAGLGFFLFSRRSSAATPAMLTYDGTACGPVVGDVPVSRLPEPLQSKVVRALAVNPPRVADLELLAQCLDMMGAATAARTVRDRARFRPGGGTVPGGGGGTTTDRATLSIDKTPPPFPARYAAATDDSKPSRNKISELRLLATDLRAAGYTKAANEATGTADVLQAVVDITG